ncbi:MAG TPA: RsmD family RNA methyltransferase [Acidimicrobiales bacterium]|nr:RsmD family RNA methyltransferase [Acidimicrobiales bacterium]
MRVVAGVARGRPLRAPAGSATRPTSDRVREALFSMLTSLRGLEGAAVADLFAGSGALGVEALSRGAATALFVDRAPPAVAAVRANLAVVGDAPGLATVLRREVLAWAVAEGAAAAPRRFDVVLADPPYAWRDWPRLLGALRPLTGLVVAETGSPWEAVPGWETVRTRNYGTTVVTILETTEGGGW